MGGYDQPYLPRSEFVVRIIWPILVILLYLVFTVLIRLIGVCPTGFIITLLMCHSIGVLAF
ncbi:hypothetical protein LINGRAHAP2_LOCUS5518 [Linum grandiflorum]